MTTYIAPAVVLLTLNSLADASCTNFTQSRDFYTRPADGLQLVSQGYVCNPPTSQYAANAAGPTCNSTSCPYQVFGTVNQEGYNNLSLSINDSVPLYDLVAQETARTTFYYSLTSQVANQTGCINAYPSGAFNPQSGAYGFTANLLCMDGMLSSCTNGPVTDGTYIKICGVATSNSTPVVIDGQVNFIEMNPDDVANMSNPAATRSQAAILPTDMESYAVSATGTSATGASATGTSASPASTRMTTTVGGSAAWFALCVVFGTGLMM